MSHVNSEMLLSSNHILAMKTDVILPPPGIFLRPEPIPEEDGDVFNTLLANFGHDGGKNFSKQCK